MTASDDQFFRDAGIEPPDSLPLARTLLSVFDESYKRAAIVAEQRAILDDPDADEDDRLSALAVLDHMDETPRKPMGRDDGGSMLRDQLHREIAHGKEMEGRVRCAEIQAAHAEAALHGCESANRWLHGQVTKWRALAALAFAVGALAGYFANVVWGS
jgi:hypothetical protein